MSALPGQKAFAATFVTSVWIQFLTLGTGALTARLLGPEGRGQFAAAQVWPGIFATIALLGINNALVIHAAKLRNFLPGLERLAVRSSLWFSGAAMALGWFMVPWLLPPNNPELIPLARLYFLYVPIFVLTSNLMAIDQGAGNFKQFNLARNILTPVYLGLLCLLWILGVRKVEWFLSALLAANLAVLLFRFSRIQARPATGSNNPIQLTGLVQNGLPFWVTDCVFVMRENAERLLLMCLLGPTALGLFVVSVTAAGAHLTVTKSLNLVIFSRSAALAKSHALKDAAQVFRIMSLVNLVCSLGMVAVQPLLIPLIFGHKFAPAIPAAALLVAAQFFQSQGSVLHEALRGQSRPFIGLTAALLGMAIFGGSGYWLAGKWGLVGVATGSILGQVAYCGFLMIALKRLEPQARLLVTREDGKRLIKILSETKAGLLNRWFTVKAG
jgi:O-antigen/teichoic acid export membrane protein